MRKVLLILLVLFTASCSGFIPSSLSSGGKIVNPQYLVQFEGGGSLSTLWYRGSDYNFHYFAHFVKTSTKYRVSKNQLNWVNEFPYKSNNEPTLVTNEISEFIKNNP